MGFTVFDKDGNPIAGDGQVDAGMRAFANEHEGWIEDAEGNVVHTSPAKLEQES